MALSRVKVWIAAEILTAADLNSEFNSILNNALPLISPLTGNLNFNGNQAVNLVFERLSAVAAAATEGRAYFHTGENLMHLDDSAKIYRVLAFGHHNAFLAGVSWLG